MLQFLYLGIQENSQVQGQARQATDDDSSQSEELTPVDIQYTVCLSIKSVLNYGKKIKLARQYKNLPMCGPVLQCCRRVAALTERQIETDVFLKLQVTSSMHSFTYI